jgi:hypothetical protein
VLARVRARRTDPLEDSSQPRERGPDGSGVALHEIDVIGVPDGRGEVELVERGAAPEGEGVQSGIMKMSNRASVMTRSVDVVVVGLGAISPTHDRPSETWSVGLGLDVHEYMPAAIPFGSIARSARPGRAEPAHAPLGQRASSVGRTASALARSSRWPRR